MGEGEDEMQGQMWGRSRPDAALALTDKKEKKEEEEEAAREREKKEMD